MTEKTFSARIQSLGGIVFILVGVAVFAIRLKHAGPYVLPGGWALVGAITLIALGSLMQWSRLPNLAGWAGVIIGIVASLPALYSLVGESEEVISLYATDSTGEPANLRLWIVDRADGAWVGMSRQKAIDHALDGARLEMLRDGEVSCVIPVLHTDLDTAQAIHSLKVSKYRAAQLAGAAGMYPTEASTATAALRLDPCP